RAGRYYDYLPEYAQLHFASTVGSWILGLGFVFILINLIRSLISGPKASPNPWGSAALEWQSPTPPPLLNFTETPIIKRGPYDYHLATEAELFEGFPSGSPGSSSSY